MKKFCEKKKQKKQELLSDISNHLRKTLKVLQEVNYGDAL